MDPIVLIVIIGVLFALLMGGQTTTPPPPTSFIFIPQPSAPRAEVGCLPVVLLAVLTLLVMGAAS